MKSVWKASLIAPLVLGLAPGCTNHAPELFPITNQTVRTGQTLDFEINAVDGDGDRLEFGIQGKPAAAVFEQVSDTSARFQWTPIASDAGPDGRGQEYTLTFLVTDGIDTDSESIIVNVVLGGAGAPVFITPADHTLDLDRAEEIRFQIEVRDQDSAEVDIRLVDGIPGGDFQSSPGAKIAAFSWRPTPAQIAERPVWGMRVGASDRVNPEVFQDITILLQGGQKKCEGTPPEVTHQALADQRGSGDYPVVVQVVDAESAISLVALYWMVDRGDGASGAFQKTEMQPAGGLDWQAVIPNPLLQQGQTATVSYYVCAIDDDDPAGKECDLRGCAPEEGRYAFTAYPAGSSQCEDDGFEPDDRRDQAAAVEFDQEGECVYTSLQICPGNEDWYRMEVPANHWAGALIAFTPANGLLGLDLVGQDGTVLLQGELDEDQIIVVSQVQPRNTSLFLRVVGDDLQVDNRYDLVALRREDIPCDQDALEPNDSPGAASQVTENVYTDLTSCGEPDWYLIALEAGDKLEVLIDFVHDDGDLDLWVFDQATVDSAEVFDCDNALGCSITETDDEQVVVEQVDAGGAYYIAMGPYQQARNSYDMLIEVTPQAGLCTDDDREPNDEPDSATAVFSEGTIGGLEICPDNPDWFRSPMFSGDCLEVAIDFVHAEGDLDLKLYGPGVEGLPPAQWVDHQLRASVTSTDDEHLSYEISEDGNYFFQVYGYNGAGNSYDLDVGFECR